MIGALNAAFLSIVALNHRRGGIETLHLLSAKADRRRGDVAYRRGEPHDIVELLRVTRLTRIAAFYAEIPISKPFIKQKALWNLQKCPEALSKEFHHWL